MKSKPAQGCETQTPGSPASARFPGIKEKIRIFVLEKRKDMKKTITYLAIFVPAIITWIHWGAFKNDMGTLLLIIGIIFAGIREIGEYRAKVATVTK